LIARDEFIKNGTVDIRLEFEFKKNVPVSTTYCLIIHGRVIEYSPMSNVVLRKYYVKYHHKRNIFPLFLIYEILIYKIKSKILCDQAQSQKVVHHDCTNVCQICKNLFCIFVGKKFIVKEVAVLRKGAILFHYIFTYPMPWNFLTKSEKYCASWLSAYHHGLQ